MNGIPTPVASAVPSLPDGWHVLSFKVLAGSRLAMIGANADVRGAWRSDYEQKTVGEARRLAAKATARVWTFDGDNLIEAMQFPLLEPFPIVEQFPDGRWLVTAKSGLPGQGNTRILGTDGTEERRIELGHCIEHIKIDDCQRIWVGWFDEGVFGNDNWRVPGLKRPPSARGLAAFDERGTLVKHAPSGGEIVDCYALNVSGNTAWACTYTDFPIWQLSNERERTWPTNLSGTRALAVSYPYVLAVGGYEDAANRAVLLQLVDQRAETLGEWRLPVGTRDPAVVSLIDGRDDELHVARDQQWHRWRVKEFAKLCD
jgi:hypothetical protein